MSKATDKARAREQRILEFMRREVKERGYAPTVREICNALAIKSTSTVHKDIENLVVQGHLRKDPSKPRAYVLVDEFKQGGFDSNVTPVFEDTVEVPVVGNVAAGSPILAEENIDDVFPLPARYVSGTNFMLKVRGESMVNVGIFDGDLILVEQKETANNGDIVVAMVDGFESEATVKTFYKESDHIRLQPENDNMSPIIVKDARILGKVKGVFRYYS
ncbi:MAG: transcriptional repressor LexA [Clostridia bacterium]|nr:transcriptional repressor LexA [Eubacterium sp.]MBR2558833.1 transcriptional repressor LexA [Bacillota bacterium]MCR4669169.1 transcriptional repressor LexA [Clostridia bacterium]